jgi:hypothetical protein
MENLSPAVLDAFFGELAARVSATRALPRHRHDGPRSCAAHPKGQAAASGAGLFPGIPCEPTLLRPVLVSAARGAFLPNLRRRHLGWGFCCRGCDPYVSARRRDPGAPRLSCFELMSRLRWTRSPSGPQGPTGDATRHGKARSRPYSRSELPSGAHGRCHWMISMPLPSGS